MTTTRIEHYDARALYSVACNLVDTLDKCGPHAIKMVAGELQDLGDDQAQPMSKRPVYRKLALLLRKAAK